MTRTKWKNRPTERRQLTHDQWEQREQARMKRDERLAKGWEIKTEAYVKQEERDKKVMDGVAKAMRKKFNKKMMDHNPYKGKETKP